MTRQIQPSADLLRFACHDLDYAVWLAKVEALCNRFLNIDLIGLIESGGLDPYDDWKECMRPERYFTDRLVDYCENEQGAVFVDTLIGIEAMWGTLQT